MELPNLNVLEGETITFKDVLLQKVADKLDIGTPTVAGASLKAVVLKNFKGEKIDVIKFKAKSRYRRKTGFRAMLTSVQISSGLEPKKIEVKKTAAKTVKSTKKTAAKKS